MRKPLAIISTLGLISLVLGGCASIKLPQDGPYMKEGYKETIYNKNANDSLSIRQELGNRPIQNNHNPTLTMYVFPHRVIGESVTARELPTFIPMYKDIEAVQPGEVMDASVKARGFATTFMMYQRIE